MSLSTRNLVRLQVQKAGESIDDALLHLHQGEQMCEGRSTPMREQLPAIVVMLLEVKKVLLRFRSEL